MTTQWTMDIKGINASTRLTRIKHPSLSTASCWQCVLVCRSTHRWFISY